VPPRRLSGQPPRHRPRGLRLPNSLLRRASRRRAGSHPVWPADRSPAVAPSPGSGWRSGGCALGTALPLSRPRPVGAGGSPQFQCPFAGLSSIPGAMYPGQRRRIMGGTNGHTASTLSVQEHGFGLTRCRRCGLVKAIHAPARRASRTTMPGVGTATDPSLVEARSVARLAAAMVSQSGSDIAGVPFGSPGR
jgi:hypothetical protein